MALLACTAVASVFLVQQTMAVRRRYETAWLSRLATVVAPATHACFLAGYALCGVAFFHLLLRLMGSRHVQMLVEASYGRQCLSNGWVTVTVTGFLGGLAFAAASLYREYYVLTFPRAPTPRGPQLRAALPSAAYFALIAGSALVLCSTTVFCVANRAHQQLTTIVLFFYTFTSESACYYPWSWRLFCQLSAASVLFAAFTRLLFCFCCIVFSHRICFQRFKIPNAKPHDFLQYAMTRHPVQSPLMKYHGFCDFKVTCEQEAAVRKQFYTESEGSCFIQLFTACAGVVVGTTDILQERVKRVKRPNELAAKVVYTKPLAVPLLFENDPPPPSTFFNETGLYIARNVFAHYQLQIFAIRGLGVLMSNGRNEDEYGVAQTNALVESSIVYLLECHKALEEFTATFNIRKDQRMLATFGDALLHLFEVKEALQLSLILIAHAFQSELEQHALKLPPPYDDQILLLASRS
eukprot:TRINITY_DN4480_c0_g1_i2.p1 TRINITY_DN4480_c0_g1~~TRINITY_DN4480_c0_g1_i2.p1  ORF type:complete len:539 (+),score=131.91 TRINITY_DN4480_c0_g1_i2:221-1618(+)